MSLDNYSSRLSFTRGPAAHCMLWTRIRAGTQTQINKTEAQLQKLGTELSLPVSLVLMIQEIRIQEWSLRGL